MEEQSKTIGRTKQMVTGGIANPLEVIERITYLLFIKRRDDLDLLAESKANLLGTPIENPFFPNGMDDTGRRPRPYSDLRWSHFTHFAPADMFEAGRGSAKLTRLPSNGRG